MTQNQINRKEMQEATLNFLDLHSEKWSPIPKVGTFKNELNGLQTQIEEAAKEQTDNKVFVGKNKTSLKNTIANKADILNDSLEVLATLNNDVKLASLMGDSASELLKLRNEEFIIKTKSIIEAAIAHMDVLSTEYGVTQEQVTDLQNDVDIFLELNGMPRSYRVASRVNTKDLQLLFSEVNDVLTEKLDKVMKIFKTRDLNFYNGYLAARKVINN